MFKTEVCPAGHYSEKGIVPCFKCRIGEYQPELGQTSCQACPDGTTTQYFGSQSVDQCLGMYSVWYIIIKRIPTTAWWDVISSMPRYLGSICSWLICSAHSNMLWSSHVCRSVNVLSSLPMQTADVRTKTLHTHMYPYQLVLICSPGWRDAINGPGEASMP